MPPDVTNRDTQQPRRTPRKEQRRRAEMDAQPHQGHRDGRWKPTKPWSPTAMWAARSGPRCSRKPSSAANPGFNENYYGFRTFGNLLEEAQNRGCWSSAATKNRAPSSHAATACHGQRLRPQAPPSAAPAPRPLLKPPSRPDRGTCRRGSRGHSGIFRICIQIGWLTPATAESKPRSRARRPASPPPSQPKGAEDKVDAVQAAPSAFHRSSAPEPALARHLRRHSQPVAAAPHWPKSPQPYGQRR